MRKLLSTTLIAALIAIPFSIGSTEAQATPGKHGHAHKVAKHKAHAHKASNRY
jgi:hypothetical protein